MWEHIIVQANFAFVPATNLGVIGSDDLDQILYELLYLQP
jgi:hypothetical protein